MVSVFEVGGGRSFWLLQCSLKICRRASSNKNGNGNYVTYGWYPQLYGYCGFSVFVGIFYKIKITTSKCGCGVGNSWCLWDCEFEIEKKIEAMVCFVRQKMLRVTESNNNMRLVCTYSNEIQGEKKITEMRLSCIGHW